MKPRFKPKLQTKYRITPLKGDPRITLVIPEELLNDLKAMSEFYGRSWKEELLARLRATLIGDEFFMAHEYMMQMIYNRKWVD